MAADPLFEQEPTVEAKTCTKCKLIKPKADFCTNRKSPDGLGSWCKACKNLANRERYAQRAGTVVRAQPDVAMMLCAALSARPAKSCGLLTRQGKYGGLGWARWLN